MPGYEERKAVNICFLTSQIMNQSKYEKLKSKYGEPEFQYIPLAEFTVKERLYISPDFNEFNNSYDAIKYLAGDRTCYHVAVGEEKYIQRWDTNTVIETIEINPDFFSKIEWMQVCISPVHRFPYKLISNCDFSESLNGTETRFVDINLKAHMFTVKKLQSPYIDDCVDYQSRGFRDRENAIEDCLQAQCIDLENKTALERVSTVGIDYLFTYSQKKYKQYCEKILANVDCELKECIGTTEFVISRNQDASKVWNFVQFFANDPSYEIQSQAKIEKIDYFCFVCGVFGTWLGFSFPLLDPTIYLFETNDTPSPENGVAAVSPLPAIDMMKTQIDEMFDFAHQVLDEIKNWKEHDRKHRFEQSRINKVLMKKIDNIVTGRI